jgi:hypothetical protein
MKKIGSLLLVGLLALAVTLPFELSAGLQVQMAASGTNAIAVSTTNTYQLYASTILFTNGTVLGGGAGSLSQNITNLYLQGGTNSGILTAGANTSQAAFLDCSKSTQLAMVAGGNFTNSTGNACLMTVRSYWSIGLGADEWFAGPVITWTVPANTNGWYYGTYLWSNCPPAVAIRTFENTNSSGCTGTNLVFKGYTKSGI